MIVGGLSKQSSCCLMNFHIHCSSSAYSLLRFLGDSFATLTFLDFFFFSAVNSMEKPKLIFFGLDLTSQTSRWVWMNSCVNFILISSSLQLMLGALLFKLVSNVYKWIIRRKEFFLPFSNKNFCVTENSWWFLMTLKCDEKLNWNFIRLILA
jgi:hypothetical protein